MGKKKKLESGLAVVNGLVYPAIDTQQQIRGVSWEELFTYYYENESMKNNSIKSLETTEKSMRALWKRMGKLIEKTTDITTQSDIVGFFKTMTNAKSEKTGKELSDDSKETYLRYFRMIVEFGVGNRFLYNGIVVPPYKARKKEKEIYTKEELAKLLERPPMVKNQPFIIHRDWLIVMFVFVTGVRETSLINIKLKDVHTENNTVNITVAKGDKPYPVTIDKKLSEQLDIYIARRLAQGAVENDWLFCNQWGDKFTNSGIYQAVERHCNSRGIESRGVHILRHQCATELARNGASADQIMMQLNHSDMRTSIRYIHDVRKIDSNKFESISPLANIG